MQVHGPICHSNGIRGYGDENADIVFVGIAPGRDEIRTGQPFTGPSGRLLDAVLSSVKISRQEVYCTNLICYHKDDPTSKEQEACRSRLVQEIVERHPKIIIPLGRIACEAFTDRPLGGKSGARGAVIWSPEWNAYIISTYHPAGILRGIGQRHSKDKDKELIYDFHRDLKKLHEILQWETDAPLAEAEYVVVHPEDDIQAIIRSMIGKGPVAFDVETYNPNVDQIDIWGDNLLCFSIAASTGPAYVFPLETIETLRRSPVDWLNDQVEWTFHNGQFDTQIVKKNLDQWITIHEDTMLQSYTLDERGGIHGLKSLAREYLGAGWWEEEREKGKKRLQDLPREQLFLYNAKDAIYTSRLSSFLKKKQQEDNVRDVYERILIPAVNAVKEIAYKGIRINKKLHLRFSIEWGQLYVDLEEQLQEIAFEAGWPTRTINLQSPDQISSFLYKYLSLPTGKMGKKGPSADMDELERMRGLHPFVDGLIRYRHIARYYDTYITGLEKHIKEDSRVHPYVKLHGARTGRWSYGDPPIQTIPQTYERDDVERDFNRTREMFIPSSKDYVFIEADYGKGEIWCAQALSGDKQMYADLMSGDYHSTTASNVMNKALEDVTKQDRLDMKHVTFGVMYWTEPRTLSKMIKSSVLQAQLYIEAFFKRNKEYKEYFWSLVRTVKETGELISPTGRKRRFFILDEGVRQLKQAVNFPIQSALGDMTELSLIELHRIFKERGLDAHVLLQVHDSLLFEVHHSIVEEVSVIIHDVMRTKFFEGFPSLPIEMSIGKNWGKTKPFHDCADRKHGGCLYDGITRISFTNTDSELLTLEEKVAI